MNTKAKKLTNYIKLNPDLDVFDIIEEEDKTYFRGTYTVYNSDLVCVIIIDDSVYIQAITRVLSFDDESKRVPFLELINELNVSYVAQKYVIDRSSNINIEVDFIADDDHFDPHSLIGVVLSSLKTVKDDYSRFMKIMWQ